jgi:hypothetical protein
MFNVLYMQLQFNKVFLLPTGHRTMIVTNQSVLCVGMYTFHTLLWAQT